MSNVPEDLADLAASWRLHLVAARRSERTIRTYLAGVHAYIDWCTDTGRPVDITRDGYRDFSAHLTDAGKSGATISIRQQGVKRFSKWIADELDTTDPLAGQPTARKDTAAVDPYTEDQLKALLATCKGKDFTNRRDEALLRFMVEAMGRAEEVCAMTLEHTHAQRGVALIERGKGGKGRWVAFGSDTARALDRYLRVRRQHPRAGEQALWLGYRGNRFGYHGLYAMIKRRAERAEIPSAHPHRFRTTGATRWLRAGGTEGGLMAQAGWTNRQMLDRYVAASANERALEEAHNLNLPDL